MAAVSQNEQDGSVLADGWVVSGRPQAAVSLVTRLDGSVLCVWNRGKVDRYAPGWSLPGGKVEPTDPTLAFAQARELREETSLETMFSVPLYAAPSSVDPERQVYVFLVHALGHAHSVEPDMAVCWLPLEELLARSAFTPFYRGLFAACKRSDELR